ncbi:MAG: hypothetical protein V3U18_02380 [Alphaproteobacteria bacterium]
MTPLERTRQRLEKAVARLEAASRASAAGAGEDEFHEKLAGGLVEALQATQADYAALREATDSVSDRLDAAIDRLRGVTRG